MPQTRGKVKITCLTGLPEDMTIEIDGQTPMTVTAFELRGNANERPQLILTMDVMELEVQIGDIAVDIIHHNGG